MYEDAFKEFFDKSQGSLDDFFGEQSETEANVEDTVDTDVVVGSDDLDNDVSNTGVVAPSLLVEEQGQIVEQLILINNKMDVLCQYSVYTMVLCLFLFCFLFSKALFGIIKDIFYSSI